MARERAGFRTAADFARTQRVSSETYRSHEGGRRGLTVSAATRYGRILGVSAAWLLTGEGKSPSLEQERPEAFNQGQMVDNALIKIAPLHVRDFVQAGNWRVNGLMPKDEWLVVDLPSVDPRYPGQPVFGVQVRDATMSQLFKRNAILSCVTTPVDPTAIEDEKIVVVERRDPYGRIERTAKQVKRDESDRLLLWERPLWDDPQAPWLLDGSGTLDIIALAIKVTSDL